VDKGARIVVRPPNGGYRDFLRSYKVAVDGVEDGPLRGLCDGTTAPAVRSDVMPETPASCRDTSTGRRSRARGNRPDVTQLAALVDERCASEDE